MTEEEMQEELQIQTDLLNLCLIFVCDEVPRYATGSYKDGLRTALLSYLECRPDDETRHGIEWLEDQLQEYNWVKLCRSIGKGTNKEGHKHEEDQVQ